MDTNSALYEVGAEYLYKMLMKVDLQRLNNISLQTDLGVSLYIFLFLTNDSFIKFRISRSKAWMNVGF